MSRRMLVSSIAFDPRGPTPCFCTSCLNLGGQRRRLLFLKWLGSTRRLVQNKRYPGGER